VCDQLVVVADAKLLPAVVASWARSPGADDGDEDGELLGELEGEAELEPVGLAEGLEEGEEEAVATRVITCAALTKLAFSKMSNSSMFKAAPSIRVFSSRIIPP
jgi:hypothetical protein